MSQRLLWSITLAAFLAIALLLNYSYHRQKRAHHDPTLPPAVYDSGSGCADGELPPIMDEQHGSDSAHLAKLAEVTATACMFHKLYPAATVQYGLQESGEPSFELSFPDHSVFHASIDAVTAPDPSGSGFTLAAFLWIPQRPWKMPPLIIARVDDLGHVSLYRTISIDADSSDPDSDTDVGRRPQWTAGNHAPVLAFTFKSRYQAGHFDGDIVWRARADLSSMTLVERVPTSITLTRDSQPFVDGPAQTIQTLGSEIELLIPSTHAADWIFIRPACDQLKDAMCVLSNSSLFADLTTAQPQTGDRPHSR